MSDIGGAACAHRNIDIGDGMSASCGDCGASSGVIVVAIDAERRHIEQELEKSRELSSSLERSSDKLLDEKEAEIQSLRQQLEAKEQEIADLTEIIEFSGADADEILSAIKGDDNE